MNWGAFLTVIALATGVICLADSIVLASWEHPERHIKQRYRIIGMFLLSIICSALAMGLGVKK